MSCIPIHGPKKGIIKIDLFKIPSYKLYARSPAPVPNCFSRPTINPTLIGQKMFLPSLPHGFLVLMIGLMMVQVILRDFSKIHIHVPQHAHKNDL